MDDLMEWWTKRWPAERVQLEAERDRLRDALGKVSDALHEIEAGDMSTFEAQDIIVAALKGDT